MAGIDEHTVLLVQSEAANGSTVFTDSGGAPNCPHAVTSNGDVRHSTAQAKFGSSSIYFDGTGDYLTVNDHADLEFGSGPLTIDLWYYPLSVVGFRRLIHKGAANYSPYMLYMDGGALKFYSTANGASWAINGISVGAASVNTWQHIAVTRDDGNNWRTFKDGALVYTTYSAHSLWNNDASLWIGSGYASQAYYGHLEEVSFSNVCRWTEAFTPPSAPYSLDDITALEDATLNLSAYYQALEDVAHYLRAHDGLELEDVYLYLQALGEIGLSDARLNLSSLGRDLIDLSAGLSAAGSRFSDFLAVMQAVSPTVLLDIAMWLSATNGTVLNDMAVHLLTTRAQPSFRSVVGQRLSSILSEVA